MADPLVTTYVDQALEQLRRQNLMYVPKDDDFPIPMRDDAIPPREDWIAWKPVRSTVTGPDLSALEAETGLAFPPLYRDFLKYRHFVNLTEFGVRFERHLSTTWRADLRAHYFHHYLPERIAGQGLLSFGDETLMEAGPVCFDTRHRDANGDCPVVIWDHDRVGTEKEIMPMFSSSAKMFACLTLAAEVDLDFVYHDDSEPPDLLPKKRAVLKQFLDVDPNGAGGPAQDYWTSWGVLPPN